MISLDYGQDELIENIGLSTKLSGMNSSYIVVGITMTNKHTA